MTDEAELRARIEARVAVRRAVAGPETETDPSGADAPRSGIAPDLLASARPAVDPMPPQPSSLGRHGAADGAPSVGIPVKPAAPPAPALEAPADSTSSEDEQYPWLQPDDVDLDLRGAPTWDPADYSDDAEDAGLKQRGRRASKWLFAKRPMPGGDGIAAGDDPRPRPQPAPSFEARDETPRSESGSAAAVASSVDPVSDEDSSIADSDAVADAAHAVPDSGPASYVPDIAPGPMPDLRPREQRSAPIVLEPPQLPEPAPQPAPAIELEPRNVPAPIDNDPGYDGASADGGVARATAGPQGPPVDVGDESELDVELAHELAGAEADVPTMGDVVEPAPSPSPRTPEASIPSRRRGLRAASRRRRADAAAPASSPVLPGPSPKPASTEETSPRPAAEPADPALAPALARPAAVVTAVVATPEPAPSAAVPAADFAASAPPSPAPLPPQEPIPRSQPALDLWSSTQTPQPRPRPQASRPQAPQPQAPQTQALRPPASQPVQLSKSPTRVAPTPVAPAAATAFPVEPAPATSSPIARAPVAAPGSRANRPRPRPRPAFASSTTGRSSLEPDLSRFLAASEPQAGDDEPERKPKKPSALAGLWKRRRRGLIKLVVVLVVAASAALLLRAFVVAPYYIPSESMEPTLHGCTGCNDDHVLVDKISYRFHDPRQSDIVVFDKPKGAVVPPGEDVLIKRVIALPGDKIAIKKGRVIINGAALDESYLNENKVCYPSTNMPAETIPEGKVFVMGDNRCASQDSRVFGPIPESSIVGRAWLIIWPLKRIGSP